MDLQKLRDSMDELHEAFGYKAGLMMHLYGHYRGNLRGDIVEAFIKGFSDVTTAANRTVLTAEDVILMHEIFTLPEEIKQKKQEEPEEPRIPNLNTPGGRYLAIKKERLSFVPYGENGRVRVNGLENLVILDCKVKKFMGGRNAQYEIKRTTYDVSPVLRHIFHQQRVVGQSITNPWALVQFSKNMPDLQISAGKYVYNATEVNEQKAINLIKLAYVVSGCVAGLPHK